MILQLQILEAFFWCSDFNFFPAVCFGDSSHLIFQKYMPGRKTEEMSFTFVECLLYTFHHMAHKVINALIHS